MLTPLSRLLTFWPYGLLTLVVALLYGQTLGFEYVWDDGSLFVENTLLREGVWNWATVARPILPDAPYFRPLVLATWMVEMALFELNPLYSHGINTLLHVLNACLVYSIGLRVLGQRQGGDLAALMAALFFAVHPCLIEGVAWVSGRFDVLATSFLLLGCTIAMYPVTAVRCACVGVLAFGAMLSKETGLLFAPIFALLVIARSPNRLLRTVLVELWPYMLAYAFAGALYFYLRDQALGFTAYQNFGLTQILSSIVNYDVWLRRLSFYSFMALMPFSSVSPLHDIHIELLSYRQQFLALAMAALLALNVVYFAFRRCSWAILCLGFYFGIFPVLGFFSINISGTIGAERFLYLPIAMLALGFSALLLASYEKYAPIRAMTIAGGVLVVGWLLLAIFVTYTTASMWRSGIQLWGWQYHSNSENRLVRLYYFNELSNSKKPELHKIFKGEIEKIQRLNNDRLPMEVQIAYANFLLRANDSEALLYFEGLISNMGLGGRLHETIYSGVLSNYAQALMVFQGDLNAARDVMTKARESTPRGSEFQIIHQMIALEYLSGNKKAAADMYYSNIVTLRAMGIGEMKKSMHSIVVETCKAKKWSDCDAYGVDFIKNIEINDFAVDSRSDIR